MVGGGWIQRPPRRQDGRRSTNIRALDLPLGIVGLILLCVTSFVFLYCSIYTSPADHFTMARWTALRASALSLLSILPASYAQNSTAPTRTSSPVATIAGQVVTYSPQYTIPASVDDGAPLIPNIIDPQAVNAQSVCPGYKASNLVQNDLGFNAQLTLAGPACNVYGTDVEQLNLTVQYQDGDRLSVYIRPSHVVSQQRNIIALKRGTNRRVNRTQPTHLTTSSPSHLSLDPQSQITRPTSNLTMTCNSTGPTLPPSNSK